MQWKYIFVILLVKLVLLSLAVYYYTRTKELKELTRQSIAQTEECLSLNEKYGEIATSAIYLLKKQHQ